MFKIIEEMKKEKKTVILVEHKIDLVAEYADEVLVLKDGRLIRKDATAKVLTDMSLAEQGVQLPQMAILGNRLVESGVPLRYIPVTEAQACEVIGEAMRKGGK